MLILLFLDKVVIAEGDALFLFFCVIFVIISDEWMDGGRSNQLSVLWFELLAIIFFVVGYSL